MKLTPTMTAALKQIVAGFDATVATRKESGVSVACGSRTLFALESRGLISITRVRSEYDRVMHSGTVTASRHEFTSAPTDAGRAALNG